MMKFIHSYEIYKLILSLFIEHLERTLDITLQLYQTPDPPSARLQKHVYIRHSLTSLSWPPNSAYSRSHSVLQRLAERTPHLSCTVGPRFWKWHGWDWRELRDWQQPRLPDWLPFRPLAQRGTAPVFAAAFAFASRPLLPWSPASPPPRGCPSCTCGKFALGVRAQSSAFPWRFLQRACTGTRPEGAGWLRAGDPPPRGQKAGGGAPTSNTSASPHAASLPTSEYFLPPPLVEP